MSGDARTEVAVVGGGPAAVAVASTLHRAGIDVVVVSGTGAVRRPSVGQSAPPGTDRLVAELIGPHTFDADAHLRSLGNRSAWGSSELVLTDFMFNPFGTGWHLDRAAFDSAARRSDRRRGHRGVARPRGDSQPSRARLGAHARDAERTPNPPGAGRVRRVRAARHRRARRAWPRIASISWLRWGQSCRGRPPTTISPRPCRRWRTAGGTPRPSPAHGGPSCTSPTPTSSTATSPGAGLLSRARCTRPTTSARSRHHRRWRAIRLVHRSCSPPGHGSCRRSSATNGSRPATRPRRSIPSRRKESSPRCSPAARRVRRSHAHARTATPPMRATHGSSTPRPGGVSSATTRRSAHARSLRRPASPPTRSGHAAETVCPTTA